MSARISDTLSSCGGLRAKRRCAACALLRMAVKGWLSSWASDPDSSPSIATRDRWASSSRCRAALRSMRLRSVTSTSDTRTNNAPAVRIGFKTTSTGTSLPSLCCAYSSRANPIARARVRGIALAIGLVRRTIPRRDQQFDRSSEQLLARVAEERVRLCVRQRDLTMGIDEQNRVRHGFHDRTKPLLACPQANLARSQLRGKLCRCDHVPGELVAHCQDDDKKARRKNGRRLHRTCDDQHPNSVDDNDGQHNASANERRAATRYGIAATPQRDRSVDDEHHEQQVADLRDDLPGIVDADGDCDDGASPQRCMPQGGNVQKVDVDPGHEVEQQRQQPKRGGHVGEPESSDVEIKVDESNDRKNDHAN